MRALPDSEAECEPAFRHFPAAELPELEVDGCTVRIIMGRCFDAASPVTTYSETLYMECLLPSGRQLTIPAEVEELAAYVVSGSVTVSDEQYNGGVLLVANSGAPLEIRAGDDSRVMIIGGKSLGERHIWWNFVSSSRGRIEQAKDDWRSGRFDPVPGDDEFIPLPER